MCVCVCMWDECIWWMKLTLKRHNFWNDRKYCVEPYAQIFIVRRFLHILWNVTNRSSYLPFILWSKMLETFANKYKCIGTQSWIEISVMRVIASLVYLLDCHKYQTSNSFLLKYFAMIFGVFGFSSHFFSVLMQTNRQQKIQSMWILLYYVHASISVYVCVSVCIWMVFSSSLSTISKIVFTLLSIYEMYSKTLIWF